MKHTIRFLLLLPVVPAALHALCPSAEGYSNTCFVSPSGNDLTGTGTVSAPFLTTSKAFAAMLPGSTMMLRAGRYSGDLNMLYNRVAPNCTATLPCTIRSFPGEVVTIDGRSGTASNSSFFTSRFGSHTDNYAGDPKVGHWRFVGLRLEGLQRNAFWFQSQNDGLEFKSIRIHGPAGMSVSSTRGLRILGSYIEVSGTGLSGVQGFALNCSPVLPGVTVVPYNNGPSNVTQTQLIADPPRWPVIDGYGCADVLIQDSHFEKRSSNSADTVGFETGRDIVVERSVFVAPKVMGTGATDTLDMKGNGMYLHRVQSYWGKGSVKLWGQQSISNVLAVNPDDPVTENAITQMSPFRTGSADSPPSAYFRPIRNVWTSPDGFIAIYTANPSSGINPVEGQTVWITDVPGCTSANGLWRVRRAISKQLFTIEGMAGEATSCNAAYNFASQDTSGGALRTWAGKLRNYPYGASIQNSTALSLRGTAYSSCGYCAAESYGRFNWMSTGNLIISLHMSGGGSQNFNVSSDTDRVAAGNNMFWSGPGTVPTQSAYCAVNHVNGGNNAISPCATAATVAPYEPTSVMANPQFADPVNGNTRLSAASPATAWNKGYYAGLHAVEGLSSSRALVKNLYPSATESVTATVSVNSNFANPWEVVQITERGYWRSVVFGRTTPLTPATTYYYKLQQGHDVVTGSFTTPVALSGTQPMDVTIASPTGLAAVASAVLETSENGVAWSTAGTAPCTVSCSVVATLARDQLYWRRWRFLNAAAATLAVSSPEALVVR
jgi:hypothetical protein